ncbi:hypothetical protein J8L84_14380 [Alteromonas sp. MMG017]|nr:hypothetical protein [Alteromonas sp. MMG017]
MSVLIGLLCAYNFKLFTNPLYNKNNPSYKVDVICFKSLFICPSVTIKPPNGRNQEVEQDGINGNQPDIVSLAFSKFDGKENYN